MGENKGRYYKVVRKDENIDFKERLRSAISGPYEIEYEVGHIIHPHKKLPHSKLFVFDSKRLIVDQLLNCEVAASGSIPPQSTL